MHFLTRLWGQERLTFAGHEWKVPFEVDESFEDMDDDDAALATTRSSSRRAWSPTGSATPRTSSKLPPATEFLQRAFAEPAILKGIICHGMWLVAPVPELVRGRPVVVHNNLLGDVREHGRDLHRRGRRRRRRPRHRRAPAATATCSRTRSSSCSATGGTVSDGRSTTSALKCADPIAIERWYTKHFGFERKRVYLPGPDQVVVIGNGGVALELFPAKGDAPAAARRERRARRIPGVAPSRVPRRRPRREARGDGRRREGHARPARHGRLHRRDASRLDLRPGRKHR